VKWLRVGYSGRILWTWQWTEDGVHWQDFVNTAVNIRCNKRQDICWLVGSCLVTVWSLCTAPDIFVFVISYLKCIRSSKVYTRKIAQKHWVTFQINWVFKLLRVLENICHLFARYNYENFLGRVIKGSMPFVRLCAVCVPSLFYCKFAAILIS
jgi:hypothetical protein